MAHILIIEDDRDIRNMTELILADAGHSVVSADDGLSGVELATCTQPDLILMDLALPHLDGWKATQRLKSQTTTSHIPIIAFTALVGTADARQAILNGCETVISKPFELEALLDSIAAALAKHSRTNPQSAQEVGGEPLL
jgi:CheY-like chemotaxis protein